MKPYTDKDGLRDYLPSDATDDFSHWPAWKRAFWISLAFLSGFLCGTARADEAIRLQIYPPIVVFSSADPTYVRASWRIAPHTENRWWSLAWASETGLSGSRWREMEGATAPVFYERLIEVSPGVYVVECCVYRVRSERHCVHRALEVH